MIEDLTIRTQQHGYGINVSKKKLFTSNLGNLNCAICPDCGYTEMFVEDTTKIKKLLEDK